MNSRDALLLFIGAGALLLWAVKTQAREINRAAPLVDSGTPLPNYTDPDAGEILPMPIPSPPVYDANDARAQQGNVQAFLDAIARYESSQSAIGYQMLVGGGTFDSFTDHPANLGWAGIRLPDEDCIAAGFSPGCVSTAAGRYQITKTTWNNLRKDSSLMLTDFSPTNQDAAAVALIVEKGALGLVQSGQFDDAIARVRMLWASMPRIGDTASLDKWRTTYAAAGGALA